MGKIKLELTVAQALALESLADCSAQDIESILLDKRTTESGKRGLQILADAIPNYARIRVYKQLEKSNRKLETLCNKKSRTY